MSEASAAECLKEIVKNGFQIKDIASYWTPIPENATPAMCKDIDAERKDICRMLESFIDAKVISPRPLLMRELLLLRKGKDRILVYKRIARALEEYTKIGMRDAGVAAMTGQDPTVICRLRKHLFTFECSFPFLQSAADALDKNLPQSRRIPAEALVQQLTLQVLEFYGPSPITAETRTRVSSAIRAALIRSMGDGTPFRLEPGDLPTGCLASLIRIGPAGYIFALAPGLDTPGQKLALAHEIRHIADRLETEARSNEDPPPPSQAESAPTPWA